jgi:hypothetical protein
MSGGTEGNHETLSRVIRCPIRDSNRERTGKISKQSYPCRELFGVQRVSIYKEMCMKIWRHPEFKKELIAQVDKTIKEG